ncbi:MAG: DUF2339 domain-containing protein [Gammaproteobacteria bacterium]|nr:DUF2339 domain-containing protein [Gammaproteobacteria bacterium]
MASVNDRLYALEQRVHRLERLLERATASTPAGQGSPGQVDSGRANPDQVNAGHVMPADQPADLPTDRWDESLAFARPSQALSESGSRRTQRSATSGGADAAAGEDEQSVATQVLGFSGAAALVLAAAYLIRLAMDSGWLTPSRQIAIAALSGFALIGIGVWLHKSVRRYAALLPAAGVVILFLTVQGAHLFYRYIEAPVATALVAAVCGLALWLARVFGQNVYVLFAVIGAYLTPFLTMSADTRLLDLVIYYSAWSALFCSYSIWLGGRHAYLVALYLAVIGFDGIWRMAGISDWSDFERHGLGWLLLERSWSSLEGPDWHLAAIYQAVQFLMFSVTTAVYSVRHRSPLSDEQAFAHAPGLLIFYLIEYSLLDRHLPAFAPWIAFASAALLLLGYLLVRPRLPGSARAGAVIVSGYVCLVLGHAGYLELVPSHWAPWVGLSTVLVLLISLGRRPPSPALLPVCLLVGLIAVTNYLRLVSGLDMQTVPARSAAELAYIVVLYLGYALLQRGAVLHVLGLVLLYGAHILAMLTISRLLDDTSVLVSISWGVLAIGSLIVALRLGDKALGQSSFVVFIVSAAKVLLYDLAGSAPLVRIACLVVLGVTLYLGGWLYQRLPSRTRTTP